MFEIIKLPKDKRGIESEIKKLHSSNKIPACLVYPKSKNSHGKITKNPTKIIVINTDEDEVNTKDEKLAKIKDPIFIESQLKKNPTICPFCNNKYSNKYTCKRHIKTACPFKKVEIEVDRKDGRTNEIVLKPNEEICCQFPNPKLRDICYVAAPYGAGKSTYTKNYITEFCRLFPPIVIDDIDLDSEYEDNFSISEEEPQNYEEIGEFEKSIYLISRITDDESFRDLITEGIMTPVDIGDPGLLVDPLNAKEEMPNSLIIFDDYELLDKNIQKSVEITLKDVLLNGRDQAKMGNDIYAVVTAHQISNYSRTRDILNECSSLTIFPKSGSTYHIKRVLKTYCGLGKQNIENILNLNGRWVTIYKRYPMWILHQGGIYKPL